MLNVHIEHLKYVRKIERDREEAKQTKVNKQLCLFYYSSIERITDHQDKEHIRSFGLLRAFL